MRDTSRRIFLKQAMAAAAGLAGALHATSYPAYAQTHPGRDTLRAGDLLWPRKPKECVLYRGGTTADADARTRWKRARESLLETAKSRNDSELAEAAKRLSSMTEEQFNALYLDNQSLAQGVPYSGADFGVGHVAIVGGSQPDGLYIVEATTPDNASPSEILSRCFDGGVRRMAYSDWIAARNEELVWHGRPFPSLSPADRAKIPARALSYLGRPYCFNNLNLGDPSAFYCSKLVWLSVKEALNRFIDDNPEPQRSFWLSPKQVLESRNVHILFSPSRYGCF